jgi:hypothetical protein
LTRLAMVFHLVPCGFVLLWPYGEDLGPRMDHCLVMIDGGKDGVGFTDGAGDRRDSPGSRGSACEARRAVRRERFFVFVVMSIALW